MGFCLGDGHSGGWAPHQTLLDEVGEAFWAAFEALRGPGLCCFSLRRQPLRPPSAYRNDSVRDLDLSVQRLLGKWGNCFLMDLRGCRSDIVHIDEAVE